MQTRPIFADKHYNLPQIQINGFLFPNKCTSVLAAQKNNAGSVQFSSQVTYLLVCLSIVTDHVEDVPVPECLTASTCSLRRVGSRSSECAFFIIICGPRSLAFELDWTLAQHTSLAPCPAYPQVPP